MLLLLGVRDVEGESEERFSKHGQTVLATDKRKFLFIPLVHWFFWGLRCMLYW